MRVLVFWIVGLWISPAVLVSQNIQKSVEDFASDAELKNASISISVLNDKKELVADWNPHQSLPPASTCKLFTTAVALQDIGTDKKFVTSLFVRGELSDGVLKGDIIISGQGDPSFASQYHPKGGAHFDRMTKAIIDLGIKEVRGSVVGDASYFPPYDIPRTWIWEDIGNYYGAGVSGLSANDNQYVAFLRSEGAGEATTVWQVEPEVPGLTHNNAVLGANNKRDNAYIFGGPYQFERKIKGTIPANRASFPIKGSLPDPALFAAQQLDQRLRNSGVKISSKAYSSFSAPNSSERFMEVLRIDGLTIQEQVKLTNQKSLNHYAEHLCGQLSKNAGGDGSITHGVEVINKSLRDMGLSTTGFHLVDGSGMSRFNAVSSNHLSQLLYLMRENQSFTGSLPVSGQSGTLRYFLDGTPAAGRFKAKSGSMERVRSYAGYLQTKEGEELVVAVIVNNYNCTGSAMKRKLEQLILQIGGY